MRRGRKFRDPETGREYETKKDCYYIYVRAKCLETFAEKMGFRIPRKRRRLKETIKRRGRKKRE